MSSQCKFCKCALEDETWIFCSSACSQKNFDFREKNWSEKVSDLTGTLNKEKLMIDSLTDSGKFFNLECLTLVELKKAIMSSELSEVEKAQKWTEVIAERILAFNQKIREIDESKFETVQRKQAYVNEWRTYGEQARKEIREKIKESDSQYQPVVQKVKATVKSLKNDPFERMAQMIAMSASITIEAARARLKSGGFKNEA